MTQQIYLNSHGRNNYSPIFFIGLLVKALLMFMYIYDTNLSVFGLPTIVTTRRLVVLGLLVYVIIKKGFKKTFSSKDFGNCWSPFYKIILFIYFIFGYSLFLLILVGRGNGEHIYEISLRFLLFGVLPIFLFKELFRSLDEFMIAILMATLIQSMFVVYSLVDPLFGVMLDSTFALDEDYVTRHRTGYAGGLNCITAPGCLKFSMGLIAAAYFCMKNKSLIYYILFIFLSVVATMIARTGLLLSFCGLMVILYGGAKQGGVKLIANTLLPLCVVGGALYYFADSGGFEDLFNFKRLQNLFEGGGSDDGFFGAYFAGDDTRIPALSFDTIIGIGITSGVSGSGIPINVDGGFLRIYGAIGIIVCILFYCLFFSQLFAIERRIKIQIVRLTALYFIMVILIGEFKEFTIFSQYMVGIFFTIVALSQENKSFKKCSSNVINS